jgi:hypothetical protein
MAELYYIIEYYAYLKLAELGKPVFFPILFVVHVAVNNKVIKKPRLHEI